MTRTSAQALLSTAVAVAWLIGCSTTSTPGSGTDSLRRAEQLLRDAEKNRSGALVLKCSPNDAEVALDGVSQGLCSDFDSSRGLWVGEGIHRIELKKPGFWPYVTYYEANGASAVLEAKLVPVGNEGAKQ